MAQAFQAYLPVGLMRFKHVFFLVQGVYLGSKKNARSKVFCGHERADFFIALLLGRTKGLVLLSQFRHCLRQGGLEEFLRKLPGR